MTKLSLVVSIFCLLISIVASADATSNANLTPLKVPSWAWGQCNFWAWGGYTRLNFQQYELNVKGDALEFHGKVNQALTCVRRNGHFTQVDAVSKRIHLYAVKQKPGFSNVAFASAALSSDALPEVRLSMPIRRTFTAAEKRELQAGNTVRKTVYLVQEGGVEFLPTGNVLLDAWVQSTYKLEFEYNLELHSANLLSFAQLN